MPTNLPQNDYALIEMESNGRNDEKNRFTINLIVQALYNEKKRFEHHETSDSISIQLK